MCLLPDLKSDLTSDCDPNPNVEKIYCKSGLIEYNIPYLHSLKCYPTQVPCKKTPILKKKNSLTELNFFYTNATSLRNKWDEFNSLITLAEFPHVLMITETWFNIDSLTLVENYTLYSKNRIEIVGGGVAIYIRDDIESSEIENLSLTHCKYGAKSRLVKTYYSLAVYIDHRFPTGRQAMPSIDPSTKPNLSSKKKSLMD